MGPHDQRSNLRGEASRFDLGLEPPISAFSNAGPPVHARDLSFRWLSGVIMTMIAGSGLLGAAAYASLDRRTAAEEPQFALGPRKDAAEAEGLNPRKGDRLVKSVDIAAARQTFRTPVAIKVGDREVVRQRAFTRVATPLALASLGYSRDVPEFNAMRLMGESAAGHEAAADPGPDDADADVSFQTLDLDKADIAPPPRFALAPEEAASQIDEHVRALIAAGAKPPLPIPPQLLLMRTSRVGAAPVGALNYARPDSIVTAPFSSIEVRMVPENVTLIPKASTVGQATSFDQRLAVVRRGESLEDVLRANGASREKAKSIAAALAPRRGEQAAGEGAKLKLLLADLDGSGLQIVRVSAYADDVQIGVAAVRDSGDFVRLSEEEAGPVAKPKPRRRVADEDEEEDENGMRLFDSLYETALKQEIPKAIIDALVRVFANDVDYQRSVAGGDSIDVFYDENDDSESKNELLYAAITTRNETFRFYRFVTPDDGALGYFDENGRATDKFLIRKPIQSGEMRSGFGMRYHPILRYSRPHTGVDFAAPIGTPIFAAGNGVVLKASWDSGGYGRRVEIQHANGYVTTYNHMSGFAKGMVEGVRVRQGQVVGYLGSTGLSTGPHLHYEVMVNGHFVDPMRIKLSREKEFDARTLALFKRERDRIDALLAKAPNAVGARVATRP